MSEVLNRLVCASANGERAPVDRDDLRELVALYERSPGEHPTPEGPFHLNEYLANRAYGGAGGRRVVVRHRPLRRLPRRLRHRGRGDGGPRREGELARRPPAGAPPSGLGALHRLAGASHRAARRRELSRDPAALRVRRDPTGATYPRRPLCRAVAPESVPVRASRPRFALAARPPAPAGGRGGRYRGVPSKPGGVPSCPIRASHPPEPRRERGRHRHRPRRARRGRVPAVPAARPAPGPLLGRGRPRRRPRALALRAARAPRHAGEVHRCGHRRARRPPRHHPPPLACADASRGARRSPRLPRPAGCAGHGRGRGRFLRCDGGRAPSLGALPRYRRHARRSVSPGAGARALPLRGTALSPRASLPRRLVRPAPPGAGRRRDRRRPRGHSACSAPGSTPARPPKRASRIRGKALGRIFGHAVRFGRPDATLLVGEGIETVLSLVTALPEVKAAAALSAGSLGAFAPPPRVARLLIARDNDAEGERAAERLARRCARAGVAASVVVPEGEDFNDDLVALGRDALAARFAHLFRFAGGEVRPPGGGQARRGEGAWPASSI